MTSSELLAVLRDPARTSDEVYDAIVELLALDSVVGVAAVFDLLATQPRFKPSHGLLIDPDDLVMRRWQCRAAAAAALLDSPHSARVAAELADELDHDQMFATDVAAARRPEPVS